MAKFKDDEYKIIHNDVKKIMHRPSQYISSLGEAGVFHLCKELIDNNRDECLKKELDVAQGEIKYTKQQYESVQNDNQELTNNLKKEFDVCEMRE